MIACVSVESVESMDRPSTQTASYAGNAYTVGVLPLMSATMALTLLYVGFCDGANCAVVSPAESKNVLIIGSVTNASIPTIASVPNHFVLARLSYPDADWAKLVRPRRS